MTERLTQTHRHTHTLKFANSKEEMDEDIEETSSTLYLARGDGTQVS